MIPSQYRQSNVWSKNKRSKVTASRLDASGAPVDVRFSMEQQIPPLLRCVCARQRNRPAAAVMLNLWSPWQRGQDCGHSELNVFRFDKPEYQKKLLLNNNQETIMQIKIQSHDQLTHLRVSSLLKHTDKKKSQNQQHLTIVVNRNIKINVIIWK